MTLSQRVLLAVCRPLFNILFSWRVEGRENIPLSGPLILVTNHVHILDPFFLVFAFPRWINFMAKEELFRSPFLMPWLSWAGCLPIRRGGNIREKQRTLERTREALERGFVLGMFPEGSRSRDGKLREGKPGPAAIASRTNVPVIAGGIIGTDRIKGIDCFWKRPAIVVHIGKPFRLPPTDGKVSKSQRRLLTTRLMTEIAALLPPEYQGAYARHEG
jgi:1-acyl-sn-glycerol-3-phosphate acyltransferase